MRANNRVFDPFFYPRSVAVIGVSPEPNNLGKNIVRNLLIFGYQGEIISVGIKEGIIFGQRIYQSLEEIERDIDLAVILTPAKTIPGLLEQCGRKGIGHVVIESAGFSEMGEEGVHLEKACVDTANKYSIRFVGPNGIGVTNMENGLALPFWPLREDLSLGSVSVLAQSGGVGLSYVGFLTEENIGINKFVSMGNKLDVDENDLLSYLIEDEGTKVILLYLESFTDGRRLFEIASASPKPIVVHKSNRFEASSGIAHSHTAALYVDDELVDHALEQAGCFRANTMADAIDCVKSFTLPPLKGNRLTVVSRSGGHAVIAADACAHYGFRLPPFPREFLERIEERFRAKVIRLQNPMDLGDLFDLAFYESIVEEILKREDVDGVLLGHGYRRGLEQEASRSLIKKVEQLSLKYQKPVGVVIFAEAVEIDYLKRHSKIPIFSAPENAMRAFYLSYTWASKQRRSPKFPALEGVDFSKAEEIVERARGREYLRLDESIELIKCYGLPVPSYCLASSPDEAVRCWQSLVSPVVLKVNRPHVSHKSRAGLVRLNLDSEQAVREAFLDFREKVEGASLEVFIQPVVAQGWEVILGGRQDQVFGPVILFGLGGVFVETLRKAVWRLAPIHGNEARAMIKKIAGSRAFSSEAQGKAGMDSGELGDLLVRLSRLLVDFPAVQEIDINPVVVSGSVNGAQALDARVILKTPR